LLLFKFSIYSNDYCRELYAFIYYVKKILSYGCSSVKNFKLSEIEESHKKGCILRRL
jgi:hypothetical protein